MTAGSESAAKTASIPVLTGDFSSNRKDKLEGIKAGTSDFITKPVDTADLVLRVRNAVAGKQLFESAGGAVPAAPGARGHAGTTWFT